MTTDPIFIKGEKVFLREKRPSDAVNDYRWRTDPEMAELDALKDAPAAQATLQKNDASVVGAGVTMCPCRRSSR